MGQAVADLVAEEEERVGGEARAAENLSPEPTPVRAGGSVR